MLKLTEIVALVRCDKSPMFLKAKEVLQSEGKNLTNEAIRKKIWGSQAYKAALQWREDAMPQERIIKGICKRHNEFLAKYPSVRAVVPSRLHRLHGHPDVKRPYAFAQALGYKGYSKSDGIYWWELAQKHIDEVLLGAKGSPQLSHCSTATANKLQKWLRGINYLYTRSYSSREGDVVVLRSVIRVKYYYELIKAKDIQEVPVIAYVPVPTDREHYDIAEYTGHINLRNGIHIWLRNSGYDDDFHQRLVHNKHKKYMIGFYLGTSFFREEQIAGNAILDPRKTRDYEDPTETLTPMMSKPMTFPVNFDDERSKRELSKSTREFLKRNLKGPMTIDEYMNNA